MADPVLPAAHDAPLPPARPGGRGTRLHLGLPYAAIPGVRPLELDLVLPPEPATAVPLVVFLQGGGWYVGGRHSAGPAYADTHPTPFERLAQAGIGVASVDYRLSGEAVWPGQLHDAKAAVRWLRSRAVELGIDPDRIAAWGESAGGHLAELLGLTGDDAALEGDLGLTGPASAGGGVVAWDRPRGLGAPPPCPARRARWVRSSPGPPRATSAPWRPTPARIRGTPAPARRCCS